MDDRMRHETELIGIVQQTAWLMRGLRAVESLGLTSWCIGAGAVRNAVWDALHGHGHRSSLADIDVAYFDPVDITNERDQALQNHLLRVEPDLPWEVTNQAGVHVWFEQVFGHPVEVLGSLEEAVASWPETATSVGVWLDRGKVRIITPLGLDDLFGMIVRRNPRRVSLDTYRQRIETKGYAERWPMVRVYGE